MSKLENLKKNDWIIITEVIPVEFPSAIPGIDSQKILPYSCNGIPLKVIAISAPWIVVDDTRFKGTIDSRYICWTKANNEYRKALEDFKTQNESENYKNLWYAKEVKTEEAKPNYKACPNCGEALTTRKGPKSTWWMICDNCKFKGELQDV